MIKNTYLGFVSESRTTAFIFFGSSRSVDKVCKFHDIHIIYIHSVNCIITNQCKESLFKIFRRLLRSYYRKILWIQKDILKCHQVNTTLYSNKLQVVSPTPLVGFSYRSWEILVKNIINSCVHGVSVVYFPFSRHPCDISFPTKALLNLRNFKQKAILNEAYRILVKQCLVKLKRVISILFLTGPPEQHS